MKLAEALIQRAALVTRYTDLKERITRNVLVQEGEKPSEDPTILLDEARTVLAELWVIITNINRTNSETYVNPTDTLTQTLANRDILRMRHNLLKEMTGAVAGERGGLFRYSRAEIKQVPVIDIAKVQQEADGVAQQLRELEVTIQQANWETDLLVD